MHTVCSMVIYLIRMNEINGERKKILRLFNMNRKKQIRWPWMIVIIHAKRIIIVYDKL